MSERDEECEECKKREECDIFESLSTLVRRSELSTGNSFSASFCPGFFLSTIRKSRLKNLTKVISHSLKKHEEMMTDND